MATKRRTVPAKQSLVGLEQRVTVLEHDVHALRTGMTRLTEEMTMLKVAVKQVDERTIRGERLMLEMQGEQSKMVKALDRIAATLAAHAEEEQGVLGRIEAFMRTESPEEG